MDNQQEQVLDSSREQKHHELILDYIITWRFNDDNLMP